jgi:phytoene dehydrogenase-like protein
VCLLFTQYAPYNLAGGQTWDEATKEDYANIVFDCIEKYAPGFKLVYQIIEKKLLVLNQFSTKHKFFLIIFIYLLPRESIVGKEVLPPPELEKVFGLTGGKILESSFEDFVSKSKKTHSTF